MTDRIKGVYVTFDKDYRDDDAEPILQAIRMVRGVADVDPKVTSYEDHDARVKVADKFADDVLALYRKMRGKA